jgi:hypothetical protein
MRTVESKAPRCGKSSFVLGLLALVQVRDFGLRFEMWRMCWRTEAPRVCHSFKATPHALWLQVASATPMMPKISSKTFHVIAKKDDVHEISLDGHTCQLTYRYARRAQAR